MRLVNLLFLVSLTFNSCSPKLRYTLTNPQTPLTTQDEIVILKPSDNAVINGIEVGTLFSGDNGLSVNCDFKTIMINFKLIAQKNGANIIKITKHDYPDAKSTCDRINVILYRVRNPSYYEKEIEWTKNRQLTWDDFKGPPQELRKDASAETKSNIELRTNFINILTRPKFFTYATFECDKSWVKTASRKDDGLLGHEQGHFDITEIYRRQLQETLDTHKIKVREMNEVPDSIFHKILSSLKKRQEIYDNETEHGSIQSKQKEWEIVIAGELLSTNKYAKE